MTPEGMLEVGDIFKTATGDMWYVDSTSPSGAYCIGLSAHPTPITTRRGVTKTVNRHLRNSVFSLFSVVDLVARASLDEIQLRRRLAMARKEGTVAEGEAETAAEPKEKVVRVSQRYVRSSKALAKELRGQSAEVMKAFTEAAGSPRNAEEIAAVCVFAGSRQDKVRVAAYYIAQFKKDGLIEAIPDAGASASA